MLLAKPPRHVYTLQSPDHTHVMSLTRASRTYVVGFIDKDLAALARKYVHAGTRMHLRNYRPINLRTHLIRAIREQGREDFQEAILENVGPLYGNTHAHLVIGKAININALPCLIHAVPFDEVVQYPLDRHLGIVIAKDLVKDAVSDLVFVGEAMEPSNNIELFRAQIAGMVR